MKKAWAVIIILLILTGCGQSTQECDDAVNKMKSPVVVIAEDDVGAFEGITSRTLRDSTGLILTISCSGFRSLHPGDTIK